jgi:hypothetical protein
VLDVRLARRTPKFVRHHRRGRERAEQQCGEHREARGGHRGSEIIFFVHHLYTREPRELPPCHAAAALAPLIDRPPT